MAQQHGAQNLEHLTAKRIRTSMWRCACVMSAFRTSTGRTKPSSTPLSASIRVLKQSFGCTEGIIMRGMLDFDECVLDGDDVK